MTNWNVLKVVTELFTFSSYCLLYIASVLYCMWLPIWRIKLYKNQLHSDFSVQAWRRYALYWGPSSSWCVRIAFCYPTVVYIEMQNSSKNAQNVAVESALQLGPMSMVKAWEKFIHAPAKCVQSYSESWCQRVFCVISEVTAHCIWPGGVSAHWLAIIGLYVASLPGSKLESPHSRSHRPLDYRVLWFYLL